jgi:hypothetical protein
LRPTAGNGPTKATVLGNAVTFARVDALPAGATITFLIECEALKAGDARFRVEYASDLNQGQEPIREEEATRILAPLVNPVPDAPPPKKD